MYLEPVTIATFPERLGRSCTGLNVVEGAAPMRLENNIKADDEVDDDRHDR